RHSKTSLLASRDLKLRYHGQGKNEHGDVRNDIGEAKPTIRGHDIAAITTGDGFIPVISDRLADEERHKKSRAPVEDHDEGDRIGCVAVPSLREDAQVERQDGQFREHGRGEVDKVFGELHFEPDLELSGCYGRVVTTGTAMLHPDCEHKRNPLADVYDMEEGEGGLEIVMT
ncbi:MAG: hypothetical protein LQ352_004929, partial [Teloschistes flavicans]